MFICIDNKYLNVDHIIEIQKDFDWAQFYHVKAEDF